MGAFGFGILGPLEARHRDELVPVRGSRERAVLAVLLLEAGRVVPLGRLVEAVWDGDPPSAAEKAVRNAVSVLRGRFAESGDPAVLIETSPAGYRMRLAGHWLDAAEFSQHAATARELASAGRARAAVAEFRAALGVWRGTALAGLGGLIIEPAAARLEEQRLAVLEHCLELELDLGRHRELTGELRALVAEWPLRERLAGLLMLALYRSGRQAEALEIYRRLAGRLAADLGLDPCAEVIQLHEAILRHDPALAVTGLLASRVSGPAGVDRGSDTLADSGRAAVAVPAGQHEAAPARVPAYVGGFAGDATEIAQPQTREVSAAPGPAGLMAENAGASGMRAALELTEVLRSCASPAEFSTCLVSGIADVVKCGSASLNEIDIDSGEFTVVTHPGSLTAHEQATLQVLLPAHPMVRHYLGAADRAARTLSEFWTQRDLRNTRLYAEYYRPRNIDYQLAVAVPARPGSRRVLAVSRPGTDYTRRECELLEFVSVQVAALEELVTTRSLIRKVLADIDSSDGSGVILLDRAGSIESATRAAHSALARYFPSQGGLRLPRAIADWMAAQPGRPLIVTGQDGLLSIRMHADPAGTPRALLLRERLPPPRHLGDT